MESTVEAKWKRDPDHTDRPDWATTRTPKGWSDSEHRNSRGEASLKGIEERLGDGSILTSQPTIPIWLTREQKEAIEKASPEALRKLASYTRNQMRADALLDNNALGIPIYIEIDGRQHERDGSYKGISQSHLDRIKDFCSRLNQGALMIRVRSDEHASEKVERIYRELKRYDKDLREVKIQKGERRRLLQEYADAMCYGYTTERCPRVDEVPEDYIQKIQEFIVRQRGMKNGFSSEQTKLLNVWVRRRSDLRGFAKVFKALEGEKKKYAHQMHVGEYYRPYSFIEGVVVLRRLLDAQRP